MSRRDAVYRPEAASSTSSSPPSSPLQQQTQLRRGILATAASASLSSLSPDLLEDFDFEEEEDRLFQRQRDEEADTRTYSIKIPRGLRTLLNDITKEVLCSDPIESELSGATSVHSFCADYLSRRLSEEESLLSSLEARSARLKQEEEEVLDRARGHPRGHPRQQQAKLRREGTFNLMDSGGGNKVCQSEY